MHMCSAGDRNCRAALVAANGMAANMKLALRRKLESFANDFHKSARYYSE